MLICVNPWDFRIEMLQKSVKNKTVCHKNILRTRLIVCTKGICHSFINQV